MKNFFPVCLFLLVFFSCKKQWVEEPSTVKLDEIQPVHFTDVHFTDNFWLPRMEINRTVSIPSAFHQCEINGRFDNFALAGGLIKGKEQQGDFPFDDTDPYKIIEGASYSLAVKFDPKLDAYLDSVIHLISAAQEPDGYLTTCVTNKCTRLSGWWGHSRWEKINSHELYNCGHLYEAAVAHFQATGKRTLLDVAIKNADLVCKVFGLGEGQIKHPSGHPIIEMALVKLYKVTGDKKYLDEARYFVDEAGRLSDGRKPSIYSQDYKPVVEQDEIVGHAVRAGYFYSGVTDVASIQHDQKLFDADQRIWNNLAGKKLYLTGGMGSRAQGEGFGPDYELNNFNNYCETCASIANVYWQYRMFLATGDAKYIDVLERVLYNGVISGVSLSGDKFFYDNPLASPGWDERQKWFGCACCPGNITRFMASVPGYVYATNKNDIYVNLFVSSNSKIKLENNEVEITQQTEYPWKGDVEIDVKPAQAGKFTLLLRIPGWAVDKPVPSDLYSYVDGAKPEIQITVNGKDALKQVRGGYCVLDRTWKAGDKIAIHLDMPVRRVQANPAVEYDKGLLAMERGPVVYCLEGIDQAKKDYIFDMVIPRNSKISSTFEKDLLNGVTVLNGDCSVVERDSITGKIKETASTFKAIPYSTWNNRGKGQMLVWTPESADYAIVKPEPTIASKAKEINGWGLNDQFEPKSSADINTPYHCWWAKPGSDVEVGYTFDKMEDISGVEVYWLAFEHYDVIYKAPASWKLYYRNGNDWKEVEATSPYGTELNKYNKLTFLPVATQELKLVATLQKNNDSNGIGYSAGVIEWKVNPASDSIHVTAVPDSVTAFVDTSFYKKYTDAARIPVVSSANVSDEALIKASEIIAHMLSKRKDIEDALMKHHSKVMIIGAKEETCDLPEYAWFCKGDQRAYWNKRARGFGGSPEDDCSASCGEENLICLPGDRYVGENILIHEFAHVFHTVGIVSLDSTFNTRLENLYEKAKRTGLWKNTYAMENKEEYFAETVQSFFNCARYADPPNGVHNAINRRAKLKQYDPDMYHLLLNYFPDDDKSYICNVIHE